MHYVQFFNQIFPFCFREIFTENCTVTGNCTIPGQHDRSANGESKFDVWTPDISPIHQTVQDQRKSDMKGQRTLYDYVHHLRQIIATKEQSGIIYNDIPPNSDVFSPQK